MFKLPLRITDKQRHINRRNLNKRIQVSTDEFIVIDGTRDEIINKFGQILNKEGRYIIVLKAVVYRIIFNEKNATIYTTPYDVDKPLLT